MLWALEAELKNQKVKQFWPMYKDSSDPTTLVAEMVAENFRHVGIDEPALRKLKPCKLSGTRNLTDDDGHVMYLDSLVSSTWKNLLKRRRGADLIAMMQRHGMIDEFGVFLPDVATAEEIQAAHDLFDEELERRKIPTDEDFATKRAAQIEQNRVETEQEWEEVAKTGVPRTYRQR